MVVSPEGVHAELEDALTKEYSLRDAVVADASGAGTEVIPALAAATATYLDATLKGGDIIGGSSSWSATLLESVNAMPAKTTSVAREVVQIVGGSGSPEVQLHATRLTTRLAELTGARPIFASSAALVHSTELRDLLSKEPDVAEVMQAWSRLTLALVGIGTLEPSPLLRRSGNAITPDDQRQLKELGAVGDVCTRYFDADGRHVKADFDDRIIGIEPDQLRAVDRRIGVAGGESKLAAIRGAWINILITDADTPKPFSTTPDGRRAGRRERYFSCPTPSVHAASRESVVCLFRVGRPMGGMISGRRRPAVRRPLRSPARCRR